MDTAFVNRVGITRGWQYQAISFYPEKRFAWIKRINPFLWVQTGKDELQGGTEFWVMPALRFNFTRQGYLRVDAMRGHETFANQRFTVGRVFADGGAQITGGSTSAATTTRGRRSSTMPSRRSRAGSARWASGWAAAQRETEPQPQLPRRALRA